MKTDLHTPGEIFGQAVSDYYHGNSPEDVIVKADDFADDRIPTGYLFRDIEKMPPLERVALQEAYGKILDVGACAGSHSLALQKNDHDVQAIDLSKKAVEVCKKRGVNRALTLDFYQVKEEKFDTLLLLMNGTGIAGSFSGLPRFFNQLKALLSSSGQVLIDSSDLRYLYSEEELVLFYDEKRYFGDFRYQLNYKNRNSEKFDWLYLDSETLTQAAHQFGFTTEIIYRGKHHDFLAQLTL